MLFHTCFFQADKHSFAAEIIIQDVAENIQTDLNTEFLSVRRNNLVLLIDVHYDNFCYILHCKRSDPNVVKSENK